MPAKRRPNAHSASSDDLNTSSHESPYSRRPRRSVASVNQTELAQTIVDLLREAEDDNGHLVCEHFIKLPSKRGNADYYVSVVEPIDLNKISQRVKMEEYRDLEILTTDVQLMVSNAKMYYNEDTEQYKDAQVVLDTYFDIKSRVLNEENEDGPSPSKQRKQTISNADQYDIMKEVYESIVTETDEEGRVISELFMKLPDQAANPGYYEVIKDPIDMRIIFDRIESKEYKTLVDLKKDVRVMAKNAMTYNKYGSQVYQDAGTIKRLFEERIAECEKGKKLNDSSTVKSSARIKHRKSWARSEKKVKVENEPEQNEASIPDPASDDLQALLYNEVVNFRDEYNNTITDPFMRLPNRRFYPTYYDEIDNPISLKTIRRKVTTQKYQNVTELHEDLELLTENAIKFNRNTAQIYKDAVTLKEFINSRISFYLNKEETGLNTPTSSSRSQRHTRQNNNMDVEQSTVAANHHADEAPIAETPAAGDSSMVTSPVQQSQQQQQPAVAAATPMVVDTNADTPTTPNQVVPYDSEVENTNCSIQKKKRKKKKGKILQNHLRSIYETVMNSVAYDDREMITLFLDKPSRKDYPDYYKLILEPIDMKMIDKKIRCDKYINIEDMLEDFRLMFNNARHYNEPGSEVYLDANALEKIMNEKVRALGPLKDAAEENSFAEEKPEKNEENSLEHQLEKLFFRVRDFSDVTNRSICDIFTHLPTKHELPDYYKIIKKPMDMERIQQKMQGGQYIKLVEMVQDMLLMFENACVYNEPGSVIYKDALILQHLAVDFFHEIAPAKSAPDVSLLVHELMCEIFISVVYHQDENGRSYSESLFNFSGDEENGEQGENNEKTSLNQIQRNLRNKRYKRFDVFQDHMFSIFEEARSKNRTDSEMYEDVVELQKVFIKTRDELTKNGELMISPAHDFTFHALETELEIERKEKLPEEARQDKEIENEGSELREKMQGKQATEAFKYKGENLQVGDYVYVEDGKSDVPHIVIIEKLYDENKDSGEIERMMYGCWFFRPKATFHLPNKKFLLKEVFKTDFYNTVPVASITGRCYVMSSKDYFKMKPVDIPHDDVYVCESRYSTRAKTFKRIKQISASFPECSSVELVKREKSLERIRVLSCFSSQQGSPKHELKNDREKLKVTLMTERDASWSELPIDVYRENTKSETQNPNNEATYYTQYLYNGTWIKLGDCVYVQEPMCPKTRIARIERLWTDRSMNVWFHGPWFVECNDTKHEPTRMFYNKEVCISTEEATIKMTQTIGKCVVLPLKDYQAMRPTEISEKDVFLFESKYFATDQSIKKVKSSRRYQPPNKVVDDEVYYFRKPLELDICSNNLLRTIVAKEVENREADMKAEALKQQEMKMDMGPQMAGGPQQQQQYGPFPQHMYQQQPYNPQYQASPLPPLPDTPIAQHRSNIQTPIPPPNFTSSTPHRPPFQPAVPSPGYPGSPSQFPVTPTTNRSAPTSSSSKRKNRGGHSTGYILFASHCHPRVRAEHPDLPFGDISKLVGEEWRNLKEETKREFEEKAKEQTARAEAEGRIPPKKKKKKKDSSHQLDDSVAMSPSSLSQDSHSRQGQSTPGPSNGGFQQGGGTPGGQQGGMYPASGQQQPAPPYPSQPPPITIQQQAATSNGIHVRKRGPLFIRPPPKPERVLMHSDAYFRYIEKLDKGSKSVGNWEQALRVREQDVHLSREDEAKLPANWLGLGKGRHETTKSALWALRDHMLKDALHMRNVLDWSTEE